LARPSKLTRSWKLLLSSDKPIYQPGQVIRLRSLALRRPDLHPVAGHDVEYSIADPKGNVIFRRRDVTSRFGIASADCPLADEIIEGPYQIECRVGETVSRRTVEVKQYVLPKFKAKVTLDRPFYEPGQRVRGTIEADYFFGKPVTGGKVTVMVEGLSEIDKIETQTDDEGRASFELRLPETLLGREQDGGEARVTLVVTVRDTAGQEYETRATRVVTTEAIHVEVIPESGTLVPGVSNRIYVLTRYPDGRPAQTRLAISGLEEELQTSRLGVASFERVGTRGEYDVTVRATDVEGRVGRRRVTLYPGRTTDDFLLRTDKAVYDGGDSMHVTVLGGGNEPVFIDLIMDGQTVLTDVIDVSDGNGAATFDLPAELFGTIQLVAYRFGDEGLPVRKQHVLYVRPAGELKIEAKLDRKQYRPGESATLRLTITDEQGNPTPGAISLAAVDEAVFAVQGARPGMEQAFFTLEQELLQPVYAIYPAWTPGLGEGRDSNERIELERALFVRPNQEHRDRDAVLREVVNEYLGGWEGALEILNGPDWEQMAAEIGLPEEAISLLRGDRSLHTLNQGSYWDKEQEMMSIQGAALDYVQHAWVFFGWVVGIGAVVQVFIILARARGALAVVGVFLLLAVLLAMILPAFQSVREAARKSPGEPDLIIMLDQSHAMAAASGSLEPPADKAATPRIRQWFPETLLWRPELITDDDGNATLEIDLADSITSWRLSASAVSADGRLGAAQQDIRVFQPFFVDLDLPVALTRGDELSLPVVVYNYLDKPQTVTLSLKDADWFERLDEIEQQVELPPGAVRSVSYRIRAKQVGKHYLQVTARGGDLADAVKREVTVEPDGRRVETVHNGNLQQPAEIVVEVPADAIPGSVKAIVKIYPSSFSQLVEGLDGIFRRPYGCFEQASSTTYPNVLALDYLKRTKQSVPLVEAKARQYIHLGYQRLLGFEVDGGGFDWFGRPPANRTLTAYGLMEFQDMARVHDVDPRLIERTRRWLLNQRSGNGSWQPEGHRLHDDPTRGGERMARLSTTAYIAWAVFADEQARGDAGKTLSFLRSHRAADIRSPYVLALVANALLSINPAGAEAAPYIARLESLKQTSTDGKQTWWAQSAGERTIVYGSGRGGQVETTATAALAMIRASRMPATVRGSLAWLIAQRGAHGTWPSTPGTVLALHALIPGP
ncbi:MAG: hypothetical protein IIA67_09805, partial [Planctomycetes bacterium]|nr:hypothetical protein [Planctomycetota bacterium]